MNTLTADLVIGENDLPIIDVRSPSEYQRGHIPGAYSVPLFDDAERAEIGTLYKRVGQQQAIKRGIEIGTKHIPRLIGDIAEVASQTRFVLHCWRGGMRSQKVAELCAQHSLQPTLIEGGYKAYRQLVHLGLEKPRRVIILAGQTGAGKTQLLHHLRKAGQQVVDLEGLAGHRGSVFGGLGFDPQPTVEQFENNLFTQWRTLDPQQPIWIEGESQSIGNVNIPSSFWQHMIGAPAIFIEVPREERLDFLLGEYGSLPQQALSGAIMRLKKRLGGARLNEALAALEKGDLRTFASLALEYYDKWYLKSLEKRPKETLTLLPLSGSGHPSFVPILIEAADELLARSASTDLS
jgi:tRNA 2-selenouridine synthase